MLSPELSIIELRERKKRKRGNEKWCTGVLGKGKGPGSIDAVRPEAMEAQHSLIKEVKDGLES